MSWAIIASHFMAFVSLLFIVNPFNASVLFIDLTGGFSEQRKKKTARTTALANFVILLLFSLTGKLIFETFGFTLAAFQVAGGMILLSTARGMTQAKTPAEKHTPEESKSARERQDIAIVPLAIPILAGPGAITSVILSMGDIRSFWVEFPIHLLILAVTSGVVYIFLIHSDRLFRRFGRNTINVFTRLMGIVMMAIGVQYVMNGIARFIQQTF